MPLKIVRNDITKMHVDAIVNTANEMPVVGTGCDYAVYQAAGREQLLEYRKKNIGPVQQGEVFLTPGFHLDCKYIIHAVSPIFSKENENTEQLLRGCYQKSLQLAMEQQLTSIAFPLISTGGFGYPKEEGFRIAMDEINTFLMKQKYQMLVYVVVFDEKSVELGSSLYPDLEAYIDQNYVDIHKKEEYLGGESRLAGRRTESMPDIPDRRIESISNMSDRYGMPCQPSGFRSKENIPDSCRVHNLPSEDADKTEKSLAEEIDESFVDWEFSEKYEKELRERIKHREDTFSEYLLYLIESRGMSYPDVYKRALVDKKVFSKIKNNPNAHPKKITAMCLCVGAKLNMDQTRDLLARAGYALSPCEKTDIIFSYFIENGIYDMIELDIQLEEHGLPCLI